MQNAVFCTPQNADTINMISKNVGHITNENTFMMCPNFIYWILQVLKDSKASKSLINQGLLRSLFDSYSYGYGHTNHGVVTCADLIKSSIKTGILGLINHEFECTFPFRSHLRGQNVDENLSTYIISSCFPYCQDTNLKNYQY